MPRSTPAERRPLRPADFLPHDLVEIASPAAIEAGVPPPQWVRASLERAPFVVVRRCAPGSALVPVGVRGERRSERFATCLPAAKALRRIRPEDLAAERAWRGSRSPQLSALDEVERLMAAHRLRWGPVGSVGFELATGVACVTPGSDLDLIARVPSPLSRDRARRLHAALAGLPLRVDLQLETPAGSVALAEYAAAAPRVVLRTREGPRWVASPWGEAGLPP